MLLAWTLTCLVALGVCTLALLLFGAHLRFSSRIVGFVCLLIAVVGSGQITAAIWKPPTNYILQAEILLALLGIVIIALRPAWNPAGHIFFTCFIGASLAFLVFVTSLTFTSGLSIFGLIASLFLLVLEILALTISTYFTFESLDSTIRTKSSRPPVPFDPGYQPLVSLQVAAYNEPPEMLIETIKSLDAVDYPNLEVVVIDNNTQDEDTWRPVEEFCRDLPRVHFFHVDGVEGFKAGALNLSLREFTDPAAEIVGIIDADYLVDPQWLAKTIGYFVDPNLAFLQTPQDYREWEGDPYLTACYDAYRYFFATSMPSRNQRNSIIFAGTMGLIRRSALEGLQGWDEWCITEDAEASLRLLKAGWSGFYINQSFGKGIMPLTFSALKGQRFRWCFGGIQILRKHLHELLPWRHEPNSSLTIPQKLDYLFGGLQWFMDLLYLGFSIVLVGTGLSLLITGHIGLPPLIGAAVLLPAVLMASGVMRALWALRVSTGMSLRRALYAFLNWLCLSWTVSIADIQAMFRSEGVFLRTPKWKGEGSLIEAVKAAKAETIITAFLWGMGIVVLVVAHASIFFAALFFWQGGIYSSSLFMSWLNQHTVLSGQLENRRSTEVRRERRRVVAPLVAGGTALVSVGAVALALMFTGAFGHSAPSPQLHLPVRASSDPGPLSAIKNIPQTLPSLVPALISENPTPAVIISPSPGFTESPTPLFSESPSPSREISPSPSLRFSPSPIPSLSPSPRLSPSPIRSPSPLPSVSLSPAALLSPTPTPLALSSPAATGTPVPAAAGTPGAPGA